MIKATLPSFNLPKATEVWLHSNELYGSIPSMVLSDTVDLRIDNNQLSGKVPRFSRAKYVAIGKNKFTFEGVLTNVQNTAYTYSLQDTIYKDTTITVRVTEPLSIDLNIDATVTTNSYKWFKNGAPFRTPTNSNKLVFDKLLPTDAGVYTCEVTNSLAGALTLYSRKITVVVALTCRYSDSLQLVSLYNATNGANWRIKTNWLTTNPINTWYGVALNTEGCVTAINLYGDSLRGTIPNLNLPNLQTLSLHTNQLNGSIPNIIGQLSQLQLLNLGGNNLIGNIPTFNLPNLTYLHLNNNKLSGSIPSLNLPNMEDMSLGFNQLSGTIPNFNLPKAKFIDMSNNQFSGNVPNFNLPQLQDLFLYKNQLTGNIPDFNLPNLEYLYLSENQLTGTIPTFNSLINLQYLYLGSNKLTGPIPDFKLPNLLYISLEYNQLTGNVPNFKLPNLIGLNIFSNRLTGNIPDFNLPNAEFINLSYNQVTGSVPNFNFPKLTTLLFSNNRINSVPRFTNLNLQKDNMYQRGLRCQYNALTFDDILPNINFATTATYIYAPQDSIYKDTTIKIIPNTPLSISLGIDSTVTTNSYQWYKNGKEFGAATSSNTFTINALTFEHAGVYTCTVSNPNAPNLKLYSRPITLTTGKTDSKKIETAITPNGDGMNDALDFPDANLEGHPENSIEIYNRWGQLVYKASPYKRDWSGQDLNGQPLPAGDYFFIMRVSIGDGQIIIGSVYLSRP